MLAAMDCSLASVWFWFAGGVLHLLFVQLLLQPVQLLAVPESPQLLFRVGALRGSLVACHFHSVEPHCVSRTGKPKGS